MQDDSRRPARGARILVAVAAIAALALPLTAAAQSRRVRAAAQPAPVALPADGLASPAQHIAILDGATGVELFCRDCETPMQPASMSKLMTILVVAEALRAGRTPDGRPFTENTLLTVSERAWRQGAMSDGSHMFLALNSQVRVGDLIRGVIVVSANDACIVLAEGVSRTEEAFVDLMNRRARQLGLTSARFRNTTGLPDPDHLISARDLARLARHLIYGYPNFYRIYSQTEFTHNNRTQQNRNPLLGLFPGADGVKTGHTDAAGYGLIGSALLNGQRRIIVFNGLRSMAERRSEADRIMRAAFYDFRVQTLYAANTDVARARVFGGDRSEVRLVTQRPVVLHMPTAQSEGLRAFVRYDGPLPAPIRAGDPVARLYVEGPNYQRRWFQLYAGEDVGTANWFAQAWTGLASFFGPQR